MKTFSRTILTTLITGAAAALLAFAPGCSLPQAQPDTTRYYVLSVSGKPAEPAAGAHWRVALRTVELPSFLRGKAMQVRVARNEIDYADDARWAENLEAGIGRVLRESLEGRGEIAHVVTSAGQPHDFDIAVRVLRCEGDEQTGVARFTATVEIYSAADGARRARDTFTAEVPGWNKQSYGDLAEKLSEAVDQLADRVVTLLATPEKS